jgi:hypothetical protein
MPHLPPIQSNLIRSNPIQSKPSPAYQHLPSSKISGSFHTTFCSLKHVPNRMLIVHARFIFEICEYVNMRIWNIEIWSDERCKDKNKKLQNRKIGKKRKEKRKKRNEKSKNTVELMWIEPATPATPHETRRTWEILILRSLPRHNLSRSRVPNSGVLDSVLSLWPERSLLSGHGISSKKMYRNGLPSFTSNS